ncbi:MAG: oligopeptide transporter, OPT family, partial [bacterium]|nr:oligopeptide transporter, OPT family [bacterium]
TSQDLKTGYLLGATPRLQQIGELAGVLTSAGAVCYVLGVLHETAEGGLGGPELPAPQGQLMSLIIDGVLEQKLPWLLIFIGVGIGLAAFALRLPVLPFAVGVYLPLYTMGAVFVGGMLRWLLSRNQPKEEMERRREQGILFGSGLVGGGGLTGVLLAIWVFSTGEKMKGFAPDFSSLAPSMQTFATQGLALFTIAIIVAIMRHRALRE